MLHNFKVSCSSVGGGAAEGKGQGGFRFPFGALFHNKIADAGDDNRQSPLDRSASSGVVSSPASIVVAFAFFYYLFIVVVVVAVAGYWVH